jgi:hypothetical protein
VTRDRNPDRWKAPTACRDRLVLPALGEHPEQGSDLEVILERVPERQLRVDLVAIAAADLLVREIACSLQLGDDALGGPLGDAYLRSNLPEEHVRAPSTPLPRSQTGTAPNCRSWG